MNTLKKNIPNFLTLGNLLSGLIGIDLVYNGQVTAGAAMIVLGNLLDFLDGFVARLLGVHSELGKQLDSLADLVTFGILPGFILLRMLYNGPQAMPLAYLVLIVPICAAWRLAKFNIDERQTDKFIGVPTPLSALLVASLPFIYVHYPGLAPLIINPFFLLGIAVLLSLLMVSELPLMSLKFKKFGWAGNQARYLFLAASAVAVVVLGFLSVALIFVLFLVISLVESRIGSKAK